MSDQIIAGYRLVRLIGNGQTSQVWEVVEQSSHRHFAMKILSVEHAKKSVSRAALFHEAEVGIQMAHPNVIKIISVDKDKKNPHYIMEFFPAGSLKERMMRKEVDFLKQNMHSILKQGATALAYVTASGWVHRDVKPDNFLVNAAVDLRLIDFALAEPVRKNNFLTRMLYRKKIVQGTRSYMSPEQIQGLPLDGRADIYSFGATMYELTTGRPPFRGDTQQELLRKHLTEKPVGPKYQNPDLTDEFSNFALKLLSKKREERPDSFHEVLMALNPMRIYKTEAPRAKN